MSTDSIAIVIATKNRPDFVIAQIRSLIAQNFNGILWVGDSSSLSEFSKTARMIAESSLPFKLNHLHIPELNVIEAIALGVSEIQVPYTLVTQDDDFPIIESMGKALSVLDADATVSAVNGKAVALALEGDGFPFNIGSVSHYPFASYTEDTPTERLQSLFRNYTVVHYALVRTSVWKDWANRQTSMPIPLIGGEMFSNATIVLSGKVVVIKDLFMIRTIHSGRGGASVQTFLDQVLSDGWSTSMDHFIRETAALLTEKDNIKPEDALRVTKQGVSGYLSRAFSRCRYRYGHSQWNLMYARTRRLWHIISGAQPSMRRLERVRAFKNIQRELTSGK